MKPRVLAVMWVLVAVVSLVLLSVSLSKWRSLTTEAARAESERQRLTTEIQLTEQQLVQEMRKHSALLQEMQWTSAVGDPSVFLTRMADLAKEKRITITAIGPLERQTSPQFNKSWHAIQVRAPYREIRELAARVEQDKGILEDVRVEAVSRSGGQPASPVAADEVQARFKLMALELSPQAKLIMDRALAATGAAVKVAPGSPLALPVPAGPQAKATGRDPFAFLTPPAPPRPVGGAPAAPSPPPEFELKGIVSFPDGFLAIVNNQIVKVGDTVSGYRVDRITESSVTLSTPGATPYSIMLPELAPTAAAPPRR